MWNEINIINDTEIEIILNKVQHLYGYDFFEYSKASIKRRINRICIADKIESSHALLKLLEDKIFFTKFVEEITVNVTEMFRDPSFYKFMRSDVLKVLSEKSRLRIWHAGCSTGEEVYSMAIVLKELNLLHKSFMYGTDINASVLEAAKKGMFKLQNMKDYSENYMQSGGVNDFSSYYTANYNHAQFDTDFKKSMLFSRHNLVSDGSFQEFDLIVCRNVLIYFEKSLQEKVFNLFDQSLSKNGYLALGSRETINLSIISKKYKQLGKQKIWQKMAE